MSPAPILHGTESNVVTFGAQCGAQQFKYSQILQTLQNPANIQFEYVNHLLIDVLKLSADFLQTFSTSITTSITRLDQTSMAG